MPSPNIRYRDKMPTHTRRCIRTATPKGDWHSLAVVSHGEYGTPEGLQFGFPVASDGSSWKVVEGVEHDADARQRIKVTIEELVQERDLVKELVRR